MQAYKLFDFVGCHGKFGIIHPFKTCLFLYRGLGVVIRDGMGDLLLAASKGLHGMFFPKATEIYVAILGLKIASQMEHHYVILEMDAKEECNQVAHLLAKQALLSQEFQFWLEGGPLWLSDVLVNDKLFS
ncbi:unnamed protein product [Prunus armeniaca]|uniref:RNase H type-1 domain-containing protein n=1 Tax=Prunus armeniaca TaxID=36596 RepID=A0A6J5TG15_PRUAR|nr:unnamed protein product [Prunus armeniaca]